MSTNSPDLAIALAYRRERRKGLRDLYTHVDQVRADLGLEPVEHPYIDRTDSIMESTKRMVEQFGRVSAGFRRLLG